jgi:uncharacterized protein (DUF433 family)
MNWEDRITADPNILLGKAIIRGTRIAVEFLLELLAQGWSHDEILRNYPQLKSDDIQAALHYAVDAVRQERVFPLAS